MLRPETALGPAAAVIEFDPQKIADLTEYTVFNLTPQFAAGVGNVDRSAEWNRTVHLQACSRKRDVFQIGDTVARPPVLVLPLDIDQIRTQHSRFNTAIQHNLLVLSDNLWRSISAVPLKIALTLCKATP
jgi:hypothetical protein